MEELTYDENVIRLALSHPAIFEGRMPEDSAISDGWYGHVDQLCADVERELGPRLSALVHVLQIKEKFGTLRFYYRFAGGCDAQANACTVEGNESLIASNEREVSEAQEFDMARSRLGKLVTAAEEVSGQICQACGVPGSRRRLSWMRTLCDEHFQVARAREAEMDRGDGLAVDATHQAGAGWRRGASLLPLTPPTTIDESTEIICRSNGGSSENGSDDGV